MHSAWIISIGTELTLGQVVDTNTAWLAARLAERGIRTARHVTIPDEIAPIRSAVLEAAGSADVVLVTGGLGPTADDLTREAMASAASVPLEMHEASLAHLKAFFAARDREMPDRNRVQAMMPQGAAVLPNACGTAPGFCIRVGDAPCYCLPGVPIEMRAMFDTEVALHLATAADGRVVRTRVLHTIGAGESNIAEMIDDLMARGRNPEIGTTASRGIVSVRINAEAASEADAQNLLDAAETELRRRLGELVYGCDATTLAETVGQRARDAGATISTAESCTGGLVGELLTNVAGSSAYYMGGVVSYANAAKIGLLDVPESLLEAHGAVSAPVAEAMVRGVARRFGTSHAISITGIAGPGGGTPEKPVGLVFVGLQAAAETRVRECRFGSDTPREGIRERAAGEALNMLRLSLTGGTGRS